MTNSNHRVNWGIGIEPEFSTELAGTRIGDYYQNPDTAVQTEIICCKKMYELFGYGKPSLDTIKVCNVFTPYFIASIFGTKLVYPEDDMPQIAEYALKNIKDVKKLKVPELESIEIIVNLLKKHEYLKRRYEPLGIQVLKPSFGGISTLSTAVSMRGNELFLDINFQWNFETVKDLAHGNPELIKEKYRNMVKEGAPRIIINLCARKIKPENIKAFIEIAKEFG